MVEHIRRWARKLKSVEAGLILLTVPSLLRAWSYAPTVVDQERPPVHWLESLMPPAGWGLLWLLVAIVCMAAIRVKKLIPCAVGLIVALHIGWCLSFLELTLTGHSPRAWVTAIGYGTTAMLIMWGFSRVYSPVISELYTRRGGE